MNIKYIITTVQNSYKEALNCLLDSMMVGGIDSNNIIISCQDTLMRNINISQKFYTSAKTQIYTINIPYILYEYSFFIAAMEALNAHIIHKQNWLFLIHDTSIIKDQHLIKTNNILLNFQDQYDIIYANNTGQHNIGLYNYNSIKTGYDIWKKYKFINKSLAIAIENNYAIDDFSLIKNNHNLKIFYPNEPWNIIDNIQVYRSNIPRVVSTLKIFDIEKYYFHVSNNGTHPHAV